MTKRAQNTSKKVNSFYECDIIVTLKWIYYNIYPASFWKVELMKDYPKSVMK